MNVNGKMSLTDDGATFILIRALSVTHYFLISIPMCIFLVFMLIWLILPLALCVLCARLDVA